MSDSDKFRDEVGSIDELVDLDVNTYAIEEFEADIS